jgi:hypothetical protein
MSVSYRTNVAHILLIGVIGASLAGSVLLFRRYDLSALITMPWFAERRDPKPQLSILFVGSILKIYVAGIMPLLGGLFIIVLIRALYIGIKLSVHLPSISLYWSPRLSSCYPLSRCVSAL